MKKIALLVILFISFVLSANAQNLYCETYTTNVRDSITVAGSTNAGSDWFTNSSGKDNIWLQVYNGANWYAYKIDFPCHILSKISAYHWGADSTLGVLGYMYNGQSVLLPLKNGYATSGTYKLSLTPTTAYWIQFIAIKE